MNSSRQLDGELDRSIVLNCRELQLGHCERGQFL